MLRPLLLILGWIGSVAALLMAMWVQVIRWAAFGFKPRWDLLSLELSMGMLAALICIWFLARASRDRTSQIFSFVVCLALAVLAIFFLPEERMGPSIMRSSISPLWFRAHLTLLFLLPITSWVWWFLRRRQEKYKDMKKKEIKYKDALCHRTIQCSVSEIANEALTHHPPWAMTCELGAIHPIT